MLHNGPLLNQRPGPNITETTERVSEAREASKIIVVSYPGTWRHACIAVTLRSRV
jgi:hypothetical protein